jgi:hypothetical protein
MNFTNWDVKFRNMPVIMPVILWMIRNNYDHDIEYLISF